MKIAVLDCDTLYDHLKDDEYQSYSRMFERALRAALKAQDAAAEAALELHAFSAIDRQLPKQLDDYAGVMIMGSKFGAYDQEVWINELRTLFGSNLPQAPFVRNLFWASGHSSGSGRTGAKSPKGWGVGVHEFQVHPSEALPAGTPLCEKACLRFIVSHQDQVEALAPGFYRLAGSDFAPML